MEQQEVRTGCISWTYPDWLGPFYPEGTKPAEFLRLYSKVFDIVEIDSTFYRMPNSGTVNQWKEKTPSNFLFTAKLPKKMTHESKLKGISSQLGYFQKTIKGLGPKLGCVIAQLPPSFKYEKGIEDFRAFLNEIDPGIRYAVEFRNESWLNKEVYDMLRAKGVCLAWSVNEYVDSDLEVTTDFLYLRFMGEYSEFTKFDRIQKDKTDVLDGWWKELKDVLGSVKQAYVLMSNHFEGFAPTTVNQFREIAGLDELDWKQRMATSENMTLG